MFTCCCIIIQSGGLQSFRYSYANVYIPSLSMESGIQQEGILLCDQFYFAYYNTTIIIMNLWQHLFCELRTTLPSLL